MSDDPAIIKSRSVSASTRTHFWVAGAVVLGVGLSTLLIRMGTVSRPPVEEVSVPAPKYPVSPVREAPIKNVTVLKPPPFSEGMYPCMEECHTDLIEEAEDEGELDALFKTRKLKFEHKNIVFEHDAENRWCLDCHDPKNRDVLHLADGRPVDFENSQQLCAQCHGAMFQDWKKGIHGKRIGSWNGAKKALTCVQCHDPHSPSFKSIRPFPGPTPPRLVR